MKLRNIVLLLLIAVTVTACSSSHPLDHRTTQDSYQDAVIAGAEDYIGEPLRFWASDQPDFLFDHTLQQSPLVVKGDRLSILALSGGGAKGAFGAGVVVGLNDQGKLPDYTIVTGISVGALIAPFVYVGDSELDRLHDVMLQLSDEAILGKKNVMNTLFKDAMSSGENMLDFLAQAYPEAMIDEVAQRHREGKRLFIGSTHFDSGELMIWNLGAIANSSLDNKVALFHQVLASSASIPGVFPPQFIDVVEGQELREELHVDGGLSAQVFFNPSQFEYQQLSHALGLTKSPQLDVIRNGVLSQPFHPVKDNGIELLSKSLSNLTLLQARGDIYRMQYFSAIDDIDMQFTYLESDLSEYKKTKQMFDAEHMKAMYNYGYQKSFSNQLWHQSMPL
ncbi:patatin-like phospholipase family protein [Vibrio ulleungensis]|uniref:Patatin-like phospholipase family protein n=1 Tax=Vibrio ulleungensis TaxID=2807619 RepID=A0ABS2HCJ3_9VIBR|nr:patatin-like phospholipase family protein [Vibrio ulleungensis]MBM7035315.1 patatin-like phospholipase family protein [Vibrio ulleungensis]